MAARKPFGRTLHHASSGASGKSEAKAILVGRRVSLNPPPATNAAHAVPVPVEVSKHQFGEGQLKQRSRSAPPTQHSPVENSRAKFGATSIGGTAPDVLLSSPPAMEGSGATPVPSTRFTPQVLEQLDALNTAIASHRGAMSFLPGSTLRSDPPPSLNAQKAASSLPRVGRYEILSRIKKGGMGSVYLCRLSGSEGFHRLFAMKILDQSDSGARQSAASFFQEAQLLSHLHHPNVVSVIDVGSIDEPYMVLDYVEGGSLFELCQSSLQNRDHRCVVSIILDALAGLDAVHRVTDNNGKALGIVHCDISPHNLLVGVDGACRLADFGIAQENEQEARGSSGVKAREEVRPNSFPLFGKPAYVAPERILGKTADQRSDIFSIGVVMYTALTGVSPFAGSSSDETLRKVLSHSPPPPSQVGFCPPAAFDFVCMKALERDPDARFQSAEAMLTHLLRVVARTDTFVSPSHVATWVCESLGPILEQRREASLRGLKETADTPSPALAQTIQSDFRELAPRVEAAEENLSPAPNSYDLREKTEAVHVRWGTLPSTPENSEKKATPLQKPLLFFQSLSQSPLGKNRLLQLALVLSLLIILFALFYPSKLSGFFQQQPPRDADASPVPEKLRPD